VFLCFGAGLLVATDALLAVLGTQAMIAYLVFGRFPETPVAAVRLGALVVAGALAETAFLGTFRWPTTFRRQRVSLAAAYLALSSSTGVAAATVAAGTELDQAAALLSPGLVIVRDDLLALRSLVDEGRRMRIEVAALNGLRRRLATQPASAAALTRVDGAMAGVAELLAQLAQAIHRASPSQALSDQIGSFETSLVEVTGQGGPGTDDVVLASCLLHLHALSGQLRAAAALVEQASGGHHRHLAPQPRSTLERVRDTLSQWGAVVRANLTFASPACRHALRLAVAVPLASAVATLAGLPRSYWVPLTVVVVLRPDFGSLLTRGAGRVLGTFVGVAAAGSLVAGLHPDHAWTVVAVAVAAWGAYAMYQANFAIGSACVAAIVLLLLSLTQVDSTTTAGDRLLDTALGGGLALIAYLVWPTWSSGLVDQALARLARSQSAYVGALTDALTRGEDEPGRALTALARAARLAWTEAEATMARATAEPSKWRTDIARAESVLGGHLRVIQAAHALRADLGTGAPVANRAALRELGQGIADALVAIGGALEEGHPIGVLPPLRERYGVLHAGRPDSGLLVALDELVDAVNTIGHMLTAQVSPPE
jgi:uncharacterized membrane protein YccC